MRAVITAGGTVGGEFASTIGTPVKALAPFGAGALIDVAIDACEAAGIDGIAVIGGMAVRAHLRGRAVRVIDAAVDGGVNVLRALDAWPGERFAYLTSDLPFATGDGVRDLLARSSGAALAMAVGDARAYDVRFPGAPAHAVTLGGERLANGSAFVIGADAVGPARALATRFFDARKSLFALARLLGPAMCLRFAAKRLSVTDVEWYGTRVLGVPVAAIRACDPGLCYDVDSLDDYRYALSRASA